MTQSVDVFSCRLITFVVFDSVAKRRLLCLSSDIAFYIIRVHEPVAAGDVTSASGLPSLPHHAVVAIDIGTTFSV